MHAFSTSYLSGGDQLNYGVLRSIETNTAPLIDDTTDKELRVERLN